MQRQQRWAIVGGGFLGMTLALRLVQQGKSVTLFEAAPALGGLASAWQLGDIVWDRHYHVTLSSDRYLRSLLGELGLETEIQWATTRTGFYLDSELHSLSNTLEFLKFPGLNLLDKVRLGATIFHASRITDGEALEGIPVIDWLEKWSGRNVVDKIWLPLLRAKLGDNYRETSAAFIWACIARMYAARRGGTKKELFGFVPRGYAHIIQRFAAVLQRAGVELRLRQSVRTVTSTELSGVKVELEGGASEGFDQVVLTAAAPLIMQMCPQLTAAERNLLNRVKYQGIICASLLLTEPLSRFYITNITNPGVPYTAIIEMTALVPRDYFGGRSLVYLPKYLSSDAPEFGLTDEQVRQSFLDGLVKMYPHFTREHVLRFQISRVKHLLPITTLNYSSGLPDIFTSIPGINMVNSTHIVNGTLNINETVRLAETAARRFAIQSFDGGRLPIPACHENREEHCQPLAGSRQ